MGTGSPCPTAGIAGPATVGARARGRATRPLSARAALALGLALLAAPPAPAQEPPPEPLSHFPRETLTIDTGGGARSFRVWVAATEPRRNQGLMFVKALAPDRGMVFTWTTPQVASFWMKNTFIPLDLLFVGPDGRLIRIVENAEPQSLSTITSMGLVIGVIELAGGSAQRLGIRAGDTVHCKALRGG